MSETKPSAIPQCPLFGTCGGCSIQNLEYPTQLSFKSNLVAKATGVSEINVCSADPYYYRNKMEFLFHSKGIGLRKKDNPSSIIDVPHCPISSEKINKLLVEVRHNFKDLDAFNLKTKLGTFKYLVIRTYAHSTSLSFVLNSDSSRLADAIEKIKQFAANSSADNIAITYVPKHVDETESSEYFMIKGTDILEETILDKQFKLHIQGFFQNNTKMAESMHSYCSKILESYETKVSNLFDLYGGVGCFGIINAPLFKNVIIIESSPFSTIACKENIIAHHATNVSLVVIETSKLANKDVSHPDFVIADPPRTGMDKKTISYLNTVKPKVIIYISCNPHQLEKDLKQFQDYNVGRVAIFDLFPQTKHVETVVELIKKN